MANTPGKLPNVDLPGYLSAHQAAKLLRCSVDYIRRLRALGVLKPRATLHEELPVFNTEEVVTYRAHHPQLGTRRRGPDEGP